MGATAAFLGTAWPDLRKLDMPDGRLLPASLPQEWLYTGYQEQQLERASRNGL